MENEKTFYNIAELTEETDKEISRLQNSGSIQPSTAVLIAQVRTQIAIAQQLSVISGTLSDLLALCKSQSKLKK